MKHREFVEMLQHFAQRPMPALTGRHVYLWHGDPKSLRSTLPSGLGREVNIHQMAADIPHAPLNREATARLLRQAIESYLDDLIPESAQQILIVTGCDLLSRYQVSLGPFFECPSDRVMVIFVVRTEETHFIPNIPLPKYVSLKPTAPFDYLRAQVVTAGAIVTGEE